MKNNLNTKVIIIVLVIALILIASPILLFVIYFHSQSVISNLSFWGQFGDFFGGILNPIISFLSLCILGYLTYLFGKNTIEENKNLHYLKLKMETFDELAKFLSCIHLTNNEIWNVINTAKQETEIKKQKPNYNYTYKKDDLWKYCQDIDKLYTYLSYFNIRFGHLFKYDFNSKEYSGSVSNAFQFYHYAKLIFELSSLELSQGHLNEENLKKVINELSVNMNSLIIELKKEIV